MKKWIGLVVLALGAAFPSLGVAQFPIAGMNSATAFGQWSARTEYSVASGSGQSAVITPGQTTAVGFSSFPTVSNGTPLTFQDGAGTETVMPANVSCDPGGGCSFTANFTYAHAAGVTVVSGTDGLQEAINALLGSGGTVIIPSGWGGTTSMITGATGAGTVIVADTRPPATTYGWNGSGYSALLTISSGSVIASHVVAGSCTGAATASATLGLYGAGNLSTTTCTSTTTNLGPTVRAGTLRNLTVTASTAGVSTSSGVVTVLDNGAATGLTCTLGTATSCADTTHSANTNVGDIITIKFTTQASETLAGVKASVILQ